MRQAISTVGTAALLAGLLAGGGSAAAQPAPTFEQTVAALGNDDPGVRLRAVQSLKQSAFPEAALPLTRSLADPEDAIQFEAIAAELNLSLAERVVPRKRVGLVIEVRNSISAASIFQQGAGVLDPRPVPLPVLNALRSMMRDDNRRVAVEAIYAFGALADNVYGADRQTLLAASAPEFSAALGAPDSELRGAALRVIARFYAWRVGDSAVNEQVGDAVVSAMNDREFAVRIAAVETLGGLRYERGLQALTEQYQHYERGAMAAAALSALAQVAHPSSAPVFAAALTSKEMGVRQAAIEGLARIGDVAQAGAITAALAKERGDALMLAGHFASVLLSGGPIDELVGGLTNKRLHDRALLYLIDAAPGRASAFSPQLSDPQPQVRAELLLALGWSGDPDAPALAERMVRDTEPVVARAAVRAVNRLKGLSASQP